MAPAVDIRDPRALALVSNWSTLWLLQLQRCPFFIQFNTPFVYLRRIPTEIDSFEIKLFLPKTLHTKSLSTDWCFTSIYSFQVYRAENFLIVLIPHWIGDRSNKILVAFISFQGHTGSLKLDIKWQKRLVCTLYIDSNDRILLN